MVIPQALSCGLPVICTENSGGKEYIKNNFNGFIIKSKSSYSIKQKILKFYNNRKLLNRMKGNTLAMTKNIDWQTYGKRTINNLNKILAS